MTAHSPMRVVLLLALVLLVGCDPLPQLRIEPSAVETTPREVEVSVDLVNDGVTDAVVADLRIEGEDWTAFAIQNETNPTLVPAGARATLRVRVTRRAFARDDRERGYASYEPGSATLALSMDGEAMHVPLHFEPAPRAADAIESRLLSLLLLGLALLGSQTVCDVLLRRFGANRSLAPAGDAAEVDRAGRIASAVGVGLLAAAWATVPVGDAVCFDLLASHAHSLDLDQCRRGSGGGPLTIAGIDGGLAVWWAAVAAHVATTALASRRRAAGPQGAALGPLAVLGLVAAGLCAVHGSLDPSAVVRAQMTPDNAVALWSWGAFSQPVGCILAVWAVARLPRGRRPRTIWGLHGLASALVVTLFFGGWSFPVLPPLNHAVAIAVGTFVFAVKLGLVAFVTARLAARPGAKLGSAPDPQARSAPHIYDLGWPTLLALALANLGATLALLGT